MCLSALTGHADWPGNLQSNRHGIEASSSMLVIFRLSRQDVFYTGLAPNPLPSPDNDNDNESTSAPTQLHDLCFGTQLPCIHTPPWQGQVAGSWLPWYQQPRVEQSCGIECAESHPCLVALEPQAL